MADLTELVGLGPLLEAADLGSEAGNFEAQYDSLLSSGRHKGLASQIEQKVRDYFAALELPTRATVYDYLLLSLRPNDLIATFNWDPLLAQAFRRHEGLIAMPQLVFLHGNVAVGVCKEHLCCGWRDDTCKVCGRSFAPSPLLFPVRQKDYTTDSFIANEWEVLQRHLGCAYFVTVFGYSAPATDSLARDTMLTVWSSNAACDIAEIELIDTKPRNELHRNWQDFITRSHFSTTRSIRRSFLSWHPRRSCDALFAATMLNQPFKDDWLPRFTSPKKLRDWVMPLYQEEIALRGTTARLSGVPCREYHRTGMNGSRGPSHRPATQ